MYFPISHCYVNFMMITLPFQTRVYDVQTDDHTSALSDFFVPQVFFSQSFSYELTSSSQSRIEACWSAIQFNHTVIAASELMFEGTTTPVLVCRCLSGKDDTHQIISWNYRLMDNSPYDARFGF